MDCNSSQRGSTGALSSSADSSIANSAPGMHHSLSTPAVGDARPSGAASPSSRKPGKMLAVRVHMLDDNVTIFQVQAKAMGKVLFEQVCKQLHLLEADYFGLEYSDAHGTKGLMQCNENTAALMASYIVQAECGDYAAEDYPDHTYLSTYKFVPHQDQELEKKIMENHKKHVRCELYGIKMHPAKDHENVPLNLAVAHMGIIVFQNYTKINTFSWAKIRKISFKRKRFLIKLHPEGYGYYKDTVEFFFEGRNECKNFWKKCVENHGFFRCSSVKNVSRHKTRVLSRGSSFRYSGKTQKEIIEFVRDNYVKRQTFQSGSVQTVVGLPLFDGGIGFGLSGRHSIGAQTTLSQCGFSDDEISLSPPSAIVATAEPPPADITTPPPQTTSFSTRRIETGTTTTITRMPSNEGCPSQTQSQSDLDRTADYTYASLPKRHIWRRSASCKDLYDFSFEETGQAKRRLQPPRPMEKAVASFEERKLESPVTRYDERPIYSASSRDSSLEIQQDIMVPDEKVYSSSYPGTTSFSVESVEDPGNYDLRDSQDDITHDSYELIEKSDDDYSTSGEYQKYKAKPFNTRSCSLDSGNHIPSDSEDERDKRHKCKSSSDVRQDIFLMDDPRDLPREIIPRKSDGSYYKQFKQSSRTSSLESKSDYYEPKPYISSKENLKKSHRDRSFGSRTSSLESKSDYETKKTTKILSAEHIEARNGYLDSRASSLESKSEYYDAPSKFVVDEPKYDFKHDYDRKISFERNYGFHKVQNHDNAEINRNFTHVHSVSLQNVETEQSLKINQLLANIEQNTVPRAQKSSHHYKPQTVNARVWHDEIAPMAPEVPSWPQQQNTQRSTESESNIFSFDDEKIQSLQESMDSDICPDHGFSVVPNLDNQNKKLDKQRKNYRDVFMEIEPRLVHDLPLHQPIERTKSDPNSLARQRLNSSSRRMLLMHQKSIDLTPAESSDEDYLYKQIPSAPPIMKYKGTHFEMPTAEFGHFDILKREVEGLKTKFEVPKSQFEILGAKTQSDFINLPPKDEDISYVLHKRHILNGAAQKEEIKQYEKPEPPKKGIAEVKETSKLDESKKTKSKDGKTGKTAETSFLFTQNIDLSKVDPVTLEVDKSIAPVQHSLSPKRDITHIDPVLLETLSSKLSQIESDSPTSSKTESIKPQHKIFVMQTERQVKKEVKTEEKAIQKPEEKKVPEVKPKTKIKTDIKPKRIIKPRMQPGKKSGKTTKTKVRITSFSSDDESLDSDDVFGSAEAAPTRVEFSPPQMRKEMESILKFESERKYLQYTMSSTEVEGSPPTSRKKTEKPHESSFETVPTELRRISERSISIPSSEDEFNVKTTDLQPVFSEISQGALRTVDELDKEDGDKSMDETLKEELPTERELTAEDQERLREKQLLQAEIENDLRDLKVPPKTKITEIPSPSLRKQGHSPLLFAHARLNLSEGSAFTLLQKQQAMDSPIAGRRAKSLDTPIIAVSRLPPLNAFSSKDDTVAEEDQQMTDKDSGLENNLISDKSTEERSDTDMDERRRQYDLRESSSDVDRPPTEYKVADSVTVTREIKMTKEQVSVIREVKVTRQEVKVTDDSASKKKEKERDQIVPDVNNVGSKKSKTTVHTKLYTQKSKAKTPPKPPAKEKPATKTPAKAKVSEIKKEVVPTKPVRPIAQKASSTENASVKQSDKFLTAPEVKRTKSQEIETTNKKVPPKEKARSLEKLELKRLGSRERSKSQEDSEPDIAKRKEKQQMLYEIAVQSTKTLKSPVKEILPVFPKVEEMVRERGGKLEISINTIEPEVPLEDAIIITKSPKKLDKKIGEKMTKSLDLTIPDDSSKAVQRLGKSLDLESRDKDEQSSSNEFDFKPETIKAMQDKEPIEETSPEIDVIQETVTADIHEVPPEAETDDKIILEGTSLDVWLSVDEPKETLDNIEVIQKSTDFFEQGTSSKPPDLSKLDTKSSSESQSLEKVSLGNSLDIRYIDSSTGDSTYKSDKDAQLIAEMQKASNTVSKFLRKKLEKRRQVEQVDSNLVKITSEEESLTEVSDLKGENFEDRNFLSATDAKDALLRLSIERSRSEDTGSWITVDCEEFVGAEESLDYDNATLESPDKPMETQAEQRSAEDINLLTASTRHGKLDMLKRSSDHSRSSDTTGSWTSGEKDLSPSGREVKETDDSSASCAIGRAIGLSQTIEKFTTKDLLDKGSPESDPQRSPRSPRSPRICILGRAFTIDEGNSVKLDNSSSSDETNDIPKDLTPIQEKEGVGSYKKFPYPFEEKWSEDSELTKRLHKKLSKKLSSADKGSLSSVDDSFMDNQRTRLKPNIEVFSSESKTSVETTESSSGSRSFKLNKQKNVIDRSALERLSTDSRSLEDSSSGSKSLRVHRVFDKNFDRLSTESRNSLDTTESSSGSLGQAYRTQKSGDIPRELSSTWKPFPLDSSGSESFEDNLLPPDHEGDKQEYFMCRDNSGEFTSMTDVYYKPDNDVTPTRDDTVLPEDLANFNNFNYPCLPSIDIGGADILGGYSGGAYLSRTLSRISERSTNSEKSSVDDDSTKASTQSDSLNDESLPSSNPQVSLSSESPSHAHVSEHGKKTPTNLAEEEQDKVSDLSKPSGDRQDPMPILGSLLQRQISDDRRTSAEMAELSIDDIEIISERGLKLKRQGSDDTIIDEECFEPEPPQKEERIMTSSSQESEDWPLPEIPQGQKLLQMHETPSSDTSQLTTQVYQPPNKNIPKTFGLRGSSSIKSQESEQWPSPPSSILEPVVGSVGTYYITPPEEATKVIVESSTVSCEGESLSDENRTAELESSDKTHIYENVPADIPSESISESLSVGPSGIKIVLEEKPQDSNSDEELNISNLNDDVFTESIEPSKHELRPPTAMRKSTASDDSSHSHHSDKKSSPKEGSHSSYSEEECTSSMGTNLEDGTVRFALKPTKCTHSSHSEDTSIALSLSEWSNSTNTVKFQNLSSNSGTTKSSSGLKSDENSLTDIAQSISEWSSSNASATMKTQQQFQKFSSTTSTGESTLTELMPSISEWSSAETKPFFPAAQPSILGSSIDVEDFTLTQDQKGVPSPKNIPSEDLAMLTSSLPTRSEVKIHTRSTERPIVIPPPTLSDTDRSSSSMEQRTVHTQRYDKDKQKYLQKHQPPSKSLERPVKPPVKLSKCPSYYSSSLSSESTPLAGTSPVPVTKPSTVPVTRPHRKPISKSVSQARSPTSENDSTSSVESPKSKSERERRGYRRKRQIQNQRRARLEKEQHTIEEAGAPEYSEFVRSRDMEEMACNFQYESVLSEDIPIVHYSETLEEGYYPDGDSQSGSDIYRMEKEEEDKCDVVEGFDVASIPPPLLEDDFEDDAKKEMLDNSNGLNGNVENNNFYCSTPIKPVNGNIPELGSKTTNGSYTPPKMDNEALKDYTKEQLMNSINANVTNSNINNTTTIIAEIEGEVKKKPRHFVDKTYYIAKEILMTELTYKKDLDVINVWFRNEVGKEQPEECQILLSLIAPLAQAHGMLVKDLEQRLQGWDTRGGPRADLMLPVSETLEQSENLATLCELQRDIIGFDSLVQPGRKFIRHGCLLKHSRKGYQQRMFFLFSDILLYTSRSQATLQFKVHGHMPLRGVLIEEPDGDLQFNGLVIYGGSSDENVDQVGNNNVGTQTKPQVQRSNTTVHVCWHRSTSISMKDTLLAVENQLSGYLLRKFKSSNGWQKLWVVFTSFCLFFYKGCLDEFPLASLPLLGYSVGPPAAEDQIGKDFVFKLQYKNHVYFFRVESEYTYNRWMEVISSATQIPRRKPTYLIENTIESLSDK
nr:unnamed protein product [Callosobruchus analis]